MTSNLTVHHYPDEHRISLYTSGGRIRLLNYAAAVVLLISCLVSAAGFIFGGPGDSTLQLISIVATIVFGICFYRTMKSASAREFLVVKPGKLDVVESHLFGSRKQSFELADITALRWEEQQEMAPHPLKGDTFDYFGFQTEEQRIYQLFADGKVSFQYHGNQIRFGKGLASWEFEELQEILLTLTGSNFTEK